jgi:hypothetical protein
MPVSNSDNKTAKLLIHLAIWFMLILVPALSARLIFHRAMEMEIALTDSMLRQKMKIEMQKYHAGLRAADFIADATAKQQYDEMLMRYLTNQDFMHLYKAHSILGQLPEPSESQSMQLQKISAAVKAQIGVEPDLVYVLDSQPQKCFWLLKPPFKEKCSPDSFRQSLHRAFQDFHERFSLQKAGITELKGFAERSPELFEAISTFEPLDLSMICLEERFSTLVNSNILLWNMPAFSGDGSIRYIVVGCAKSSLNGKTILSFTTRKLSGQTFRHTTGFSSLKDLPTFSESAKELSLISELPETFNYFAIRLPQYTGKKPVIRISCDSPARMAAKKFAAINNLVLLYAILMSFILFGTLFNRFRFCKKLHYLIMAGFFFGILLPLSGTVWLGICYLNTQRIFETEAILDWMQQRINEKEQAIRQQKSRNSLFQNIFSRRISRLQDSELLRLNDITGFRPPGEPEKSFGKVSPAFRNRFDSYTLIKPGLEDYSAVGSKNIARTDTVQPFFSGAARDTLVQLGAFSHLPDSVVKPMLQRAQLTMGLLDKTLDKRVIIRTFAEEQAMVFNSITTGISFINGMFWRNRQNEVTGLSLLQNGRSAWLADFFEMLEQKRIRQVFYHRGYEISLHVFMHQPVSPGKADKRKRKGACSCRQDP